MSWPGEQRVRELRQHGVLVADDALDQRLAARATLAHGVGADLLLDRAATPSRCCEALRGLRDASWRASVRARSIAARRHPPSRPRAPVGASRSPDRRNVAVRTLTGDLAGTGAPSGDGDSQQAVRRRRVRRSPTGRPCRRARTTGAASPRSRPPTARPVPPPLRRDAATGRPARRWSSSTASSTTATSGSTATTSAPPRATSSRTRSRSPTRSRTATEHVLALEVACPPQRDRTAKRDRHRRVRALGLRPTRRGNPGGTVAADARRRDRAGADRAHCGCSAPRRPRSAAGSAAT